MNKSLIGKKLLILGGINAMVEVVQRAKELGVNVYVTDYLPDSPAKKVADRSFMVSTTDVANVVKLIRDEKIDGVYTGNIDSMLPFYAQICSKAGLPCYGTLEQFKLMTDKAAFKAVCRENDVPVVPEYSMTEVEQNRIQYPVIVKPVDSSGSRGITICYNADELNTGIKNALAFSRSGKLLIEKYMTGDEVVLYYYFQNGNPVFAAMCDRYVLHQGDCRVQLPTSYVFPSRYTRSHLEHTNRLLERMFRKIGLTNGPLFLQAFIEDGIPYIYEPGYRTNGAREQYIIENTCGFSSVDMLIRFALTGSESEEDLSEKADPFIHGKCACKLSPLIGEGKIARIDGFDRLSISDYAIKTVLNNHVGDEITEHELGTLRQIAYRSFIVADDFNQLGEKIDGVQKMVIFRDTSGKSMMLQPFDIAELGKYKE